jgi:hypothetical protein
MANSIVSLPLGFHFITIYPFNYCYYNCNIKKIRKNKNQNHKIKPEIGGEKESEKNLKEIP